jgi:hypothetical protein
MRRTAERPRLEWAHTSNDRGGLDPGVRATGAPAEDGYRKPDALLMT